MRRSGEGTNWWGVQVLISQTMVVEEAGRGRDCSWREVDVEFCRALRSGRISEPLQIPGDQQFVTNLLFPSTNVMVLTAPR